MLGVVGHRGITSPEIGSFRCCEDGARRQEAMGPGFTSVGGSCKPDVGSSTIEETADLEGSNDGVAKGKGVRLNFRLVITGGVCIGVAANLDQLFCRKGNKG